jgi:hypothetical protein
MKTKLLPFLLLVLVFLSAQEIRCASVNEFPVFEDSLRHISYKLFHCKTDESRKKFNDQFLTLLEQTLKVENAYAYPFDSLTDIGRLTAPDGTFRMFTWNVPNNDGTQMYYNLLLRINPKSKKTELFKLDDKSAEIKNPESQMLDYKKWYGCLYYKIIQNKAGKTTYYTLLGWDSNNNQTWKKLIDVLWFDKEGIPKFGEPIFQIGKLPKKRIIFEFRAEMIMALKYNEDKHMIIFDNIAPESPEAKGIYENYVMDGSYNAFVFKKGKWNYIEDVNALNPKTKNDAFYNDPKAEPDKKTPQKLGPAPKSKKTTDSKTGGQK